MKKKTEYSTMTVMMVIFFLALFIVLPPFFRVMFAEEEMEVISENKALLVCTKDATVEEGFNVTSSTYYVNDTVEKNTINFFLKTNDTTQNDNVTEERVIDPVIQYNVEDPAANNTGDVATGDNITGAGATGATRTVKEEIEFFKSLADSVNFVENETLISVEINNDSLAKNSGNLELSNYLSPQATQEDFYIRLGYVCYVETF